MPKMAEAQAHLRSLYRSLLRELPPPSTPFTRSPLRKSIREHFSSTRVPATASPATLKTRRQELEQFLIYLRAQRMYGTLLERYNPGMGMNEEERVRLTARRVGMDMPVEWYGKVK